MEFLALKPRPGFFKRFRFAFLLGFCFACLAAAGTHKLVVMDQEYPTIALVSDMILAAVVGFGIGWLGIILARGRIRSVVASQVRTGAAAAFGTRTFSWDETGVSIVSPVWCYEWKWTAVDAVWDGPVGLHFIWRGQLLFSVPKRVLPADAQPERLREMFRRLSPPMLPNKALQPTAAVPGTNGL